MRVRRKNNWDMVLTMSYEEVRSSGLLYVIREEPFHVEYKTSVLIGISMRDLHVALPILDNAAPALRIRRYFKATLKNDLNKVVLYHRNLSVILHELVHITSLADHRIDGDVNVRLASTYGTLYLNIGKRNVRSTLAEGRMWSNPVFNVEWSKTLPLHGVRKVVQVFWEEHVRASEILAHTQRAFSTITGS